MEFLTGGKAIIKMFADRMTIDQKMPRIYMPTQKPVPFYELVANGRLTFVTQIQDAEGKPQALAVYSDRCTATINDGHLIPIFSAKAAAISEGNVVILSFPDATDDKTMQSASEQLTRANIASLVITKRDNEKISEFTEARMREHGWMRIPA